MSYVLRVYSGNYVYLRVSMEQSNDYDHYQRPFQSVAIRNLDGEKKTATAQSIIDDAKI